MKLSTLTLAAGLLVMAGCGEHMQFPVTESAQAKLPPNLTVLQVSEKNLDHVVSLYYEPPANYRGAPPPSPARYSYRVGVGDQLLVQVWTTPERSGGTDQAQQPVSGPIVDETGKFFYPFVGEVQASGRTLREIRSELTEKLQAYLRDPQVEVSVQDFRAHQVMTLGAVGSPGPTKLTNVPLHLVDLINQAGVGPKSDISRVALRRRGVEYTVNLRLFLEKGMMAHNPVILPGDTVFVPELVDNHVYVFGEIATTKLQLDTSGKTLTEILAEVGGIDRQRANARGVFVFRRTDLTQTGFDVVFQFDVTEASTLLLMNEFPIMAQDIIFVTKDPITRWTDTVGRVLAPAGSLLQVQGIVNTIED
jgi:polysaccharide export outer membrane protein